MASTGKLPSKPSLLTVQLRERGVVKKPEAEQGTEMQGLSRINCE